MTTKTALTDEEIIVSDDGMTLRDYFAAKAMQGIVVHDDVWEQADSSIAISAYALADAMLAQREKKNDK